MPRLLTPVDPTPRVPALPTVTWWAEQLPPWTARVVDRMVDSTRTAQLSPFDNRVRVGGGVPLQVAANRTTRTLNRSQPGTWTNPWPSVPMPFPLAVWVDQKTTDFMWFGIDPARNIYWEAVEVGPFGLFQWQASSLWAMGSVRIYDLNMPWDRQQRSITGGGLPMWPMVPSIEALDAGAGGVQHALHFVVSGGYSSEPSIPPARKSDGTRPGHPLRAGARLRLTAEAFDRLSADVHGPHDAALLWALHVYGAIVNDRTADVGHLIRLPDDPRLDIRLGLRLTDLEVLV